MYRPGGVRTGALAMVAVVVVVVELAPVWLLSYCRYGRTAVAALFTAGPAHAFPIPLTCDLDRRLLVRKGFSH